MDGISFLALEMICTLEHEIGVHRRIYLMYLDIVFYSSTNTVGLVDIHGHGSVKAGLRFFVTLKDGG
jgi:hypothetical protein